MDRQQKDRLVRLYPVWSSLIGMLVPLRIFLLFAMLGFCLGANAVILDPPVLRCASVNATGDVTLTWTIPPDPGGDFDHYEINHSNNAGGPFVAIGTVSVYAQTTFIHVGSGAAAAAQFYMIRTVSSALPPNVSLPSDTVGTLFLEVFQSTPLGSAVITWTAPSPSATAVSTFSVWMEYPVGTWSLLDEVPDTVFSYRWVVSICEDSLTFRVGLADATGCISFSNRDGEVFEDVTPPTVPLLSIVSVDTANGLSTIEWVPSPEADTEGYIVVLVTPGGGVIIDTLWGQGNSTYQWLLSSAGDGPETFTLAAFDTCRTGIPPSPNTSATGLPHTTIHTVPDYEQCAGLMNISWTPYQGLEVLNYQLFQQVDGGVWVVLGTYGPEVTSVQRQVAPDRTYCFLVKAIFPVPGLVSLSNVACINTVYPGLPDHNYVRTVTVIDEDRILVVDSVDFDAIAGSYDLERSDNGGDFEVVASAAGGAGPLINFIDEDVDPATVGYRYRVQVMDSCGNPAILSNVGGNIVLRAYAELGGTNVLAWNGYSDWDGVPISYTIYRSVDGMPFVPLVVGPAFPWTYTDNVEELTASTGRFCYYVEASEGGNSAGIDAVSASNIACAVQEDLVFIPNAFIVGGANPVFQPVMSYVDVKEYELSIISRWGMVVWTTNDPAMPWNGEVDGQLAPEGVYAYYCAFSNGAGRRIEKRGTVTLLTALE